MRKSKRSIDPEFDACHETLVSFIEGTIKNNKKKNNKDGPSLLLSPIPTINNNISSSQRSISRQRSSNNAPLKRRNRSFASSNGGGSCTNNIIYPTLPQSVETNTNNLVLNNVTRKRSTISDVASELSVGELSLEGSEGEKYNNDNDDGGESGDGMVDISLEDINPQQGGGVIEGNNSEAVNIPNSHPLLKQQHVNNTKPPGLPRYSSPINVIRTGSGVSSANGGGSVTSDTYLSSSIRSLSSRSQSARSRSARSSRSRSRSRGGHLRMRSLGASNAFSSAQSTGSAATGGYGEGEELVDGEGDEQQHQQQPITIPLKDILSVDEEVPSRKRGESQGSDFYSSAASDVDTAKIDNQTSTSKATNGGHYNRPHQSVRSPSPPPLPSNSTNKVSHRIFLRTLSHGYVEFSLENENSHDIFMAYLKAHLPSDRIPQRLHANNGGGGSSNAGSSSLKHHPSASGLLKTMVLTPTKEVPSNLSSSSSLSQRECTSKADSTSKHKQKDDKVDSKVVLTPRSRPKLVSRDSSNVSVCSNKIDKLHSKIINQRIQSESTPLQRIKEGVATWVSSVMDCACCQDTTVAPLDTSVSHGSETPDLRRTKKGRSPNSEALRNRGIGGLSFEVEAAPTPKLSFERS